MTALAIMAFVLAVIIAVVANARARNRSKGLNANGTPIFDPMRDALETTFLQTHGSAYDPNSFNPRVVGSRASRARRWRRKRAGQKV